jgi:hypothetical protein
VFFRTAVAETFEVWSFTANVALSLPARLVLESQPPTDGWVIDGSGHRPASARST